VTEALCGHSFSASAISAVNKSLDEALRAFAERRLSEPFPYLILDARYEKVREAGIIISQAVLLAVAVDGEGQRQIIGVNLAGRESRSSWREFLLALQERGLFGVEFVVSDDHPGLKLAICEVFTGAAWQRCYVHFLRNALDHLPRKLADDCLQELRWIGACPRAGGDGPGGPARARRGASRYRRLAGPLAGQASQAVRLGRGEHRGDADPRLRGGRLYYRLPVQHHKHMKSTNMLERLNQELKRRTHVVRIFPNAESCLRLVRALAVETHENWLEGTRYLNMQHLAEHKKEALREAA